MTNVNNIFGAKVINSLSSSRFEEKTRKYLTIATDSTELFIGDFVKLTNQIAMADDGSYLPVCTQATNADKILGVVSGFKVNKTFDIYRKANTLRVVEVVDDPLILLEIQCRGTLTVSDVGKEANIYVGSGNTNNGLSGMELDVSTIGTGKQLKIISISQLPGNEVGAYTKVICIISYSEMNAFTAEDFWDRTGTTLKTHYAGDNVELDGTLTVNNNTTIDGKLTVTGLIDPTGLLVSPQATPPSTNDGTHYYNSTSKSFQFRADGKWVYLPQPYPIINVASDFPTLAEVYPGITYRIGTNVTDNDVSKTNTGQSFLAGQEIFWNATNWTIAGDTALWGDDLSKLSPISARDINIASGQVYKINNENIFTRNNSELGTFNKGIFASINEINSFPNKIFNDISYFCTATPTQTLATSGAGDLAAKIATLVDGDILEIQVDASYSAITIPAGKRFAIRVKKGYDVQLNSAQAITLANGAANVFLAGFIFDSNPSGSNNKGSAICFEHQAIVNDITFYNCTFRNNSHSAVLLSYHQSISGDNYATANLLAEFSNRIAFVECHFDRASNDTTEGGAIVMRGIFAPFICDCDINGRTIGRGVNLQNCQYCFVTKNNIMQAGGGGNGEGIKLDSIGSPTYFNNGVFYKNRVANCIEGIDIDDTAEAIVIQNIVSGCTDEGISLDDSSKGVFLNNIAYNNDYGIRFEVGSVGNLKGNVCFNNTTTDFFMENGYTPDNSNTTAISDTFIGADKIPYDNTASGLTATLVQDAIDEIYSSENLWNRVGTTLVPNTAGDIIAATSAAGDQASITSIASLGNSLGYLRHVAHVGGVSTLDIDAIDDTGTGTSTINFGYNTTASVHNYIFYNGAAEYNVHPSFVIDTQIIDKKYCDDLTRRVYEDLMDPTGFVNLAAVLSFVNGTRTFTITGSHKIYISGISTIKTTASIVIANTVGVHWIYYDGTGALSESTSPPDFYVPLIATVYWDGAKGVLGEERHGINMYGSIHSYLHKTVGARYVSGLGGTFTNTTFSIAAGSFADEDLTHTFLSPLTSCNLFYKNGSATFTWDGAQAAPYKTVAGTIQFNNGNNLSDVNISGYVAYWVFATNDIATPIMILMGQAQYNTLNSARANALYESLVFGQLPYQEAKLLYRVIYQNVAGTPAYVEDYDYRSVSNLPAGSYVATDHNILSNIQIAGAGVTFGHINDEAQYINGEKRFRDAPLVTFAGTAKAASDFLVLENKYNAADMVGTGTAITFNQYYYDASPNTAYAGSIECITDSNWDINSTSQTAYFDFYCADTGIKKKCGTIDPSGINTEYYIGSTSPAVANDTSYLYRGTALLWKVGTATQVYDVLRIGNMKYDASMVGTGAALVFEQGFDGGYNETGRIYCSTETNWTSTSSTQDSKMIFQVSQDGVLVTGLQIESTKAVSTYGLTTVNHAAAVNDPTILAINTARRALITCRGDSTADGADKICGGIRFEDIQATGGSAFILWQPGVSGQPVGIWNGGRQFYVTNTGEANFYGSINTAGDVMVNDATDAYYLGPQTLDGSWRWIKDGNNTVMQRRESASWVTKTTFSA